MKYDKKATKEKILSILADGEEKSIKEVTEGIFGSDYEGRHIAHITAMYHELVEEGKIEESRSRHPLVLRIKKIEKEEFPLTYGEFMNYFMMEKTRTYLWDIQPNFYESAKKMIKSCDNDETYSKKKMTDALKKIAGIRGNKILSIAFREAMGVTRTGDPMTAEERTFCIAIRDVCKEWWDKVTKV